MYDDVIHNLKLRTVSKWLESRVIFLPRSLLSSAITYNKFIRIAFWFRRCLFFTIQFPFKLFAFIIADMTNNYHICCMWKQTRATSFCLKTKQIDLKNNNSFFFLCKPVSQGNSDGFIVLSRQIGYLDGRDRKQLHCVLSEWPNGLRVFID